MLPPGPPLTDEQRALVEEAAPLAPAVVSWLLTRGIAAEHHADELQGVVYDGFIQAARQYQPGLGRWKSYAFGGALLRCRGWLRTARRHDGRHVVVIRVRNQQPEGALKFEAVSVVPDSAPPPDTQCFRHQVLALVERLPERERIGVTRYLDDTTLEQVAEAHGVTREGVRRWEVSGLQLLREQLGLVPRTRRKSPRRPLHAEEHLRGLLSDGTPRTVRKLAELTGYTRQAVGLKLREWGATTTGWDEAQATLWVLLKKGA